MHKAIPAALAGVAVAGSLLASSAWSWDSNVTATGRVTGCSTAGPFQMASVRANLNGQIATWNSQPYSSPPAYALRWSNVPSGGGWAFVVVHCSAYTPDYSRWIRVQRPAVGENWASGNI